jgi:hypothetical protein
MKARLGEVPFDEERRDNVITIKPTLQEPLVPLVLSLSTGMRP